MSSPGIPLTLENVAYAKKESIAYVTVSRPKLLNALNQRTWEELRAAFTDARDDPDVRGVILTGAGDKAFIAGADRRRIASILSTKSFQPRSCCRALKQACNKSLPTLH
jgi:enoyl-CoA hydratase